METVNTPIPSSSLSEQELYILLSDQCNFSCSHCLNSSGPKATRWMPTADSIKILAEEINQSPLIKLLHFSGGEPTLFLAQIRQLLAQITRAIPVVFTTNAWFSERSVHFLDDLPLASVVISYDRYHAPFTSLEKIMPLVKHFQSKNIDVSFNFVFSDFSELAEMVPIQALGITVHTSRVIKSGRARFVPSWFDNSAIKQTCPSLEPRQRRVPELAKAVYISGQGFTPCCGPMVFDEHAAREYAFTPTLTDYPSNRLLQDLSVGTFEEQAKSLGLDLSALRFQSSCDACTLLHAPVGPGLPSIAEVAGTKAETTYLPFAGALSPEQEQLLLQRFITGYTETLDPKELKQRMPSELGHSGDITAAPLTPADHLAVEKFVRVNYYAMYPNQYSKANVEEFANFCPEYLSWPSTRGIVYRKNDQIVATIFANTYDPHPALKIPTLHIGYWGYERALVTKDEAAFIKNHWLSTLSDWSEPGGDEPARIIDASFDSFNTSAIRLARSVGFKRKMLRLNKKGAEA